MDLDKVDDRKLVKAFQRGHVAAFDEWVKRHQDRVYRLARGWLRDESLAQDATQEAFMRSVEGLKSFRFSAEPFTWLYRTLRNVCHELNRTRPQASYEEQPDFASNPERLTVKANEASRLRELVDQLPERQREVVYLRVFEELSIKTTAAVMDCRPGTVKALLSQAKQRLEEQWT